MSAQPQPSQSHAYASAYAQHGLRVAPIAPGKKHPSLNGWPEEASADQADIDRWWGTSPIGHAAWGPGHGVSIVTGKGSGVFILDVDPRHGGDDTLAALEAQHGTLPDTVQVLTGGGGWHLYFRWPELAEGVDLRNSAGKLGPGLDIRAEGGQAPAPPTIHPNGRAYEFEVASMLGDVPFAEPPAWLVDLATEETTAVPEGQVEDERRWDQRYAWDRCNGSPKANEWSVELLERHGWHSRKPCENAIYLVRPGKGPKDGYGITVGKVAPGVARCFTDGAPPLEEGKGYRPAELYALLEHGGDRVAADAALMATFGGAATHFTPDQRQELEDWITQQQRSPAPSDEDDDLPAPVDWPAFWRREHVGEEWTVRPILPKGRQVALWATHKTGKSLITLEVAAALATGKAVLSQEAGDPVDVVYLDYEMTEDDLFERLDEMGYSDSDDLARFHYYLLPSLPPLDTGAGGDTLVRIIEKHQAQAVVIDTMARAAAGDENDADTYRNFYRHTGIKLKAMGVSVLRLDHGGKDPTRGQRGSSGKGDDVDVVFKLTKVEGGLLLKRDVSRMNWVPEKVVLHRQDNPLRHVTDKVGAPVRLEGVEAMAEEMAAMGITSTMSQRQALSLFRGGGGQGDSKVAREAHRMLRELEVAAIAEGPKMPWEGA